MTGNVYIHDENDDLLFHAIVGFPHGVESITVDLDEAKTITMDGFEQAYVMPADTQLSMELTAGIWELGTDIEAGVYVITSPYGLGYLQIFEPNEDPVVFEVIGGGFEGTKSDIQLRKGQKLRITDISMIQFQTEDSPSLLQNAEAGKGVLVKSISIITRNAPFYTFIIIPLMKPVKKV